MVRKKKEPGLIVNEYDDIKVEDVEPSSVLYP